MSREHLDPRVNRSLRCSVRDGIAYSVMSGAAESYLTPFALFLHASAQQIALLAAVPPLIGSWTQLFSAWLGRYPGRRHAIIVAGALSQAVLWLPLALLPLVLQQQAVTVLIVCVMLYHAAGNLISPQWSSLMGDLVPERRRGRFFARRTRFGALASFAALAAGGGVLHAADAAGRPLAGFLALFGVALIARLVSAGYLARMHDPESASAPTPEPVPRLREWLRSLPGSAFLRFSLPVAAMQGAVAIASPFFAVHMLRDLGFSYLEFMANTAASVLMQFLTLAAWGRISDSMGNRLVLVFTGWCIPVVPLLWVVWDNFWWLCAVQAFSGLAWAGFSLSTGNFLYDLRPGRPLAGYMALYAVLGSAAVFVGAVAGGYLAARLPTELRLAGFELEWTHALYGLFVLSAAARVAVAALLSFRVREVRSVRSGGVRGLVFRLARYHPVSGVVFELVTAVRKVLR